MIFKFQINVGLNLFKSYFKWWKSWASGDGKNGKWYPEWAFKVDNNAIVNQSQAVAMCALQINTPKNGGKMLLKMCSKMCNKKKKQTVKAKVATHNLIAHQSDAHKSPWQQLDSATNDAACECIYKFACCALSDASSRSRTLQPECKCRFRTAPNEMLAVHARRAFRATSSCKMRRLQRECLRIFDYKWRWKLLWSASLCRRVRLCSVGFCSGARISADSSSPWWCRLHRRASKSWMCKPSSTIPSS